MRVMGMKLMKPMNGILLDPAGVLNSRKHGGDVIDNHG
jgi:hypothetical protein